MVPVINEAARCLEEEVVARSGEVDLASVLGFGFPAFRGGVLRFADTLGIADVARRLERLEESEGERFRPAPLLTQMADGRAAFSELDEL